MLGAIKNYSVLYICMRNPFLSPCMSRFSNIRRSFHVYLSRPAVLSVICPVVITASVCACRKVSFEDVIAEARSVRRFDKVWLRSPALFEVTRLLCHLDISFLPAVPV